MIIHIQELHFQEAFLFPQYWIRTKKIAVVTKESRRNRTTGSIKSRQVFYFNFVFVTLQTKTRPHSVLSFNNDFPFIVKESRVCMKLKQNTKIVPQAIY